MILRTGRDPLELPLDSLVHLIYAWMTEGADKDSLRKFDRDLFQPPPNAKAEEIANLPEWSPEAQGASFMAAMQGRSRRK